MKNIFGAQCKELFPRLYIGTITDQASCGGAAETTGDHWVSACSDVICDPRAEVCL